MFEINILIIMAKYEIEFFCYLEVAFLFLYN